MAKKSKPKSKAAQVLIDLAELGKTFKGHAPRDLSVNHDYYLYGGQKKVVEFETTEEEVEYWGEQDPSTYHSIDLELDDEPYKTLILMAKAEGITLPSLVRRIVTKQLDELDTPAKNSSV
jgi:hypothetical protein